MPHRRAVPLLASLFVLGWFGCSSSTTDLFSDPDGAGTAGTPAAGAGAGLPPGGSSGAAGSASAGSANGGQAGSGATTGGSGAAGGTDSGGTSSGGTSAGEAGAETGGTDTGGSAGTAAGGMGGSTGGMAGSAIGGMAGSVIGGMAGAGAGGDAGGGGDDGCSSDGDCHDTEYCRKTSCDAAMGRCAARREQCTGQNAELMPVCGCNGVTYYNECVAVRDGINVAQSGECSPSSAVPCTRDGGGDDCMVESSRARCYRNRSNCAGTSPTEGVCWVLPDECPDEPATTRYCGGTAGQARCVGLCEIVEAEDSFFRDAPACANNSR